MKCSTCFKISQGTSPDICPHSLRRHGFVTGGWGTWGWAGWSRNQLFAPAEPSMPGHLSHRLTAGDVKQAPANGLWQYMQYEPLMTYPWKILEVFCETNNDWSLVGLQLVWEKDPSRLPIKEGPWHAMAVSKCQTRPGTTPFLDNNTSSWPRLVLRALAGSA